MRAVMVEFSPEADHSLRPPLAPSSLVQAGGTFCELTEQGRYESRCL
jgi:hypothetical protein